MNASTPTLKVTPNMSMEEFQHRRLEERRAKNRESAAESRRRVKQKIESLESRLQQTQEENQQLRTLLNSLLIHNTFVAKQTTTTPQSHEVVQSECLQYDLLASQPLQLQQSPPPSPSMLTEMADVLEDLMGLEDFLFP